MCCDRDIHAINFSPEGCAIDADGNDDGGSEKERVVLYERDNETSLFRRRRAGRCRSRGVYLSENRKRSSTKPCIMCNLSLSISIEGLVDIRYQHRLWINF